MESCHLCRTIFKMPHAIRPLHLLARTTPRRQFLPPTRLLQPRTLSTDSLPRVMQPPLWQSLVPKPFRRSADGTRPISALKTSEWNLATVYIVLALLAGSQAITLMNLRRQTRNFSRKAEAKLSLLREVIQRVKDGEDVDVEGLLGTGDEAKEREWEEVLDEIEREDALYTRKRHKLGKERIDAARAEESEEAVEEEEKASEEVEQKGKAGAKFY